MRDYFAAQAMAAIMREPFVVNLEESYNQKGEYIACWAYDVADWMLDVRTKGGAK